MRPVLFRWRGMDVHSYPAMLYTGLVVGVFAGNVAAHASHLDAGKVFAATFLLIIPALAGARLLFVASHWQSYRDDIKQIWNPADGMGQGTLGAHAGPVTGVAFSPNNALLLTSGADGLVKFWPISSEPISFCPLL